MWPQALQSLTFTGLCKVSVMIYFKRGKRPHNWGCICVIFEQEVISSAFANAALCEISGRTVDSYLQKCTESLVFIVITPVSPSRMTFELFLILKDRLFIMMSVELQAFSSVSVFRVTQESQTLCSVLAHRSTTENKFPFPLCVELRCLDSLAVISGHPSWNWCPQWHL